MNSSMADFQKRYLGENHVISPGYALETLKAALDTNLVNHWDFNHILCGNAKSVIDLICGKSECLILAVAAAEEKLMQGFQTS